MKHFISVCMHVFRHMQIVGINSINVQQDIYCRLVDVWKCAYSSWISSRIESCYFKKLFPTIFRIVKFVVIFSIFYTCIRRMLMFGERLRKSMSNLSTWVREWFLCNNYTSLGYVKFKTRFKIKNTNIYGY